MQARRVFFIFRQGYCSCTALEERVKSVRDLLEMAIRSDDGRGERAFLMRFMRRCPVGAWPAAQTADLDQEGAQRSQDHAQHHAPGERLAQE